MSEIEGGGGSVESGGSGEVSSSSEVSETSSAETGGEASEATQEATTEEAGESGGFDEDSDTTESPEDSVEDSDESEYDEEPDDSQEVGFSEGDDVDNPDSQNDKSEYEDSDSSDADENGVGFDDSDDDCDISNDVEPDDTDDETEADNIDNDQDEGDHTEASDSTDAGDEAEDELDGNDDFEDQDNEYDLGEPEDYSDEDALDDPSDGDEANDDVDGDGTPDDADSDTETDTEGNDNIDNDWDAQDDEDSGEPEDYSNEDTSDDYVDGDDAPDDADSDTETDTENENDHTEDPDSTDGNDDVDGDNIANDADSDSVADTEDHDSIDDDYDEDEDPGEVEQYSEEALDNHNEADDSTDEDSEAERKQEDEEQAVEEENREAADRAENETENADAENTVKNGEANADSESQNLPENIAESQNEPVTTENGNNEVDTENNASRVDGNDAAIEVTDIHTESAANNEGNSSENRDQNEERPEDANAKLDNTVENPDNEDAHRTAMKNMADYMSEHNYGRDDYAEYSKDPEWYKLNSELQQSLGMEVTPPTPEVARSNMSDYMNEHNYGRDDYAEYSKDPEWQKLNADLQKSLGMEVTTDTTAHSPESGKEVSAPELSDNCVMVNASDIDMTYAQGMDSEQFWNHHGNTKEDYMRMAERIPDVQQALDSGKSLDEIKQDPELKDTVHAYFDPENMIEVEQQADGSYSFTDDGRHRIAAAQEFGYEIPVEVTNMPENAEVSNADNMETQPEGATVPEDVANKSDMSNETCENLGAFEQNTWDNLSQAEKEQAVEKLRDSIAEDLQLENKPNVAYYYNEKPGDYGGYAASTNTIYINRFNMDNAAETADTIAHESRHCWQHERADNPQTEQDYRFKENFDDYVRPEDDFYEYQNQPVETDARDYAQGVKDAIPKSGEMADMESEQTHEDGELKNDDDTPPSTTGPPENIDKKETVYVSDLPEDFERKTEFTPVSNDVKKSLEGSGLTDDKINEIRNKPKPDYKIGEVVNPDVHKPDPSTYLKPEYVSKHLEPFEKSGCFRIQKTDPTNPNDIYDGTVGHSSGAFVTSGEDMKKAIQESGGDVRKMEKILGLEDGSLGNNPTIISINSPSNLRMPSGNELGASQKEFIPGGFTSGNQPEAVIDSVSKGDYKVTKFNNPNVIDWIDKRGEI